MPASRWIPSKVDIDLQGVPVCRGGLAADFSEDDLKKKLDQSDCLIRFAINGRAKGSARFWTCDLTEKYIEINASYRTIARRWCASRLYSPAPTRTTTLWKSSHPWPAR